MRSKIAKFTRAFENISYVSHFIYHNLRSNSQYRYSHVPVERMSGLFHPVPRVVAALGHGQRDTYIETSIFSLTVS